MHEPGWPFSGAGIERASRGTVNAPGAHYVWEPEASGRENRSYKICIVSTDCRIHLGKAEMADRSPCTMRCCWFIWAEGSCNGDMSCTGQSEACRISDFQSYFGWYLGPAIRHHVYSQIHVSGQFHGGKLSVAQLLHDVVDSECAFLHKNNWRSHVRSGCRKWIGCVSRKLAVAAHLSYRLRPEVLPGLPSEWFIFDAAVTLALHTNRIGLAAEFYKTPGLSLSASSNGDDGTCS